MLMEITEAQDIQVRTNKNGLVLVVTSEVGSEVVVDEICIKSNDPKRLLASLSDGALRIREILSRTAA